MSPSKINAVYILIYTHLCCSSFSYFISPSKCSRQPTISWWDGLVSACSVKFLWCWLPWVNLNRSRVIAYSKFFLNVYSLNLHSREWCLTNRYFIGQGKIWIENTLPVFQILPMLAICTDSRRPLTHYFTSALSNASLISLTMCVNCSKLSSAQLLYNHKKALHALHFI